MKNEMDWERENWMVIKSLRSTQFRNDQNCCLSMWICRAANVYYHPSNFEIGLELVADIYGSARYIKCSHAILIANARLEHSRSSEGWN